MQVSFTKMEAAGNDFILMDDRSEKLTFSPDQIIKLCQRQRGVGADGVLLLRPSKRPEAEWAWKFFNSDGSEAEMCGNGARCFARYIQRVTGSGGRDVIFETGAGLIRGSFNDAEVTVDLTAPTDLRLDFEVALPGGPVRMSSVNTGVPHAVVFVSNADQAMVSSLGREIRYCPAFAPKGTNVNFVQLVGEAGIRARTYERGVEGETLACGTGVTASALVTAKLHGLKSPISVRVQGGDLLKVSFKEADTGFEAVRLTGPAEFVFEGQISLSTLD